MTIHQEKVHPDYVEGCFGCKISTITTVVPPGFNTRDPWARNGKRAMRIIKEREEKAQGLTDLRYGRRVDRATEESTLAAPNIDGVRPKSLF